MFLLTQILPPNLEHQSNFTFLFGQSLSNLIVVDKEVRFEPVSGLQLHFHFTPSLLFDAVSEDLSFQVIPLTLHTHLLTPEQSFLQNCITSFGVDCKFVTCQLIQLFILAVLL